MDPPRVNLAGDFCADPPTNAGPTPIEAKQDSGIAACELAEYLIAESRRKIAARFADRAASAPLKRARKSKPAAPPRATGKNDLHLHSDTPRYTLSP